jgi:hypothetical protein
LGTDRANQHWADQGQRRGQSENGFSRTHVRIFDMIIPFSQSNTKVALWQCGAAPKTTSPTRSKK